MHQIMTDGRLIHTTASGWARSVAAGLGAAWRTRQLVLIVWLGFLALGLFAAMPSWRGYAGALAHAPEGDRLLSGLKLPLLMELTASEAPGSPVVFPWMMLTALIVALLANPFVTGGVIAVLSGRPDDAGRTVRERFFAGGARHYWRLARLLLLGGFGAVLMLTLVAAALFGAMIAAEEGGSEVRSLSIFFGALAVLGLLAGLFSLVLDFARIAVVRDGLRTWGAIKTGLRMLFRRFGRLFGFGLTFALLLGIAWALFIAASSTILFSGWGTIALGMALQQGFALVRTGLRIAMIGGELRMLPPPTHQIRLPEPEPEITGLS